MFHGIIITGIIILRCIDIARCRRQYHIPGIHKNNITSRSVGGVLSPKTQEKKKTRPARRYEQTKDEGRPHLFPTRIGITDGRFV